MRQSRGTGAGVRLSKHKHSQSQILLREYSHKHAEVVRGLCFTPPIMTPYGCLPALVVLTVQSSESEGAWRLTTDGKLVLCSVFAIISI